MADNVNIIVQDTINDIVVNAAVIVETIEINVQAAVDEVQIIANPNNYVVNINRIIGEQVQSDWEQKDDQAPDYIKNKPTIPTLTSALTNDGSNGINPFITAADVTPQVNSDWNAVSGIEQILNKPTLATVATSGSYTDLSNKPTIPAAQVNSDWNAINGVAEILNKPTIPAAQVNSDWNATTGVAQILNKPTIPAGGLPSGGTAGQILTKVDATDYNATWQENFADWTSVVKHTVKNNGLSGTITKGTAVYVTGSNGTNMLVGRASNTSEATSSKTMGLMQSDITTTGGNQTGFVITEGLIQGLNTAGQTAGDPVWLGVNGALIYGLANKPYAPAHLVFIGIVTKVSAGNGEIFVKVQNGFELKEIHDVDIITTTPINGHLLGFDGTLWVNKTIAGWLGFTPVTDARTISTTAPLSGGGDLTANRTLSISQATTSTNGYLSSTDWNTFNGKGSGTVTSVSALTLGTTGTDLSSSVATGTTTPVITLNVPTASATNRGALSSTDWTTFNGKQAALVSGTNIKTINGTTLLGSGDLVISSSNIYNADGSLTAARTLTLNAFPLTFAGTTSTRFFANGNLGVNQTTDAGFKLDVNGTARVSGTLSVKTASGSQKISFNNTDQIYIGLASNNNQIGANNSNRLYIGSEGDLPIYTLAGGTVIIADLANPASSASAKLRIDSTTQGFLPPRMTTTQKNAIATPAAGLVVYDTTLNKLCVRTAAAWETITSI
jgi:hypothetical protein